MATPPQSMLPESEDKEPFLKLTGKDLLKFIDEQTEKDRRYFDKLLKWFGSLALVLVAVAGFFNYKSWTAVQEIRDETRQKMKTAVEEETTTAKIQEQVGKVVQQKTEAHFQNAVNKAVADELNKPEKRTFLADSARRAVGAHLAPRRLTEGQKLAIGKSLAGLPVGLVTVYSAAPQEQITYAQDFLEALRASAWKDRLQANGVAQKLPETMGFAVAFTGILIIVSDPNPLANLLENALTKAGVSDVRISTCPSGCVPPRPGDIWLYVGSKY